MIWFSILLALMIVGIIVKPWNVPDYIWALGAALTLCAVGVLPLKAALTGVLESIDVIAFLIGMMLLAQTCERIGIFTLLAECAIRASDGSPLRLFAIVYCTGIATTMFLSNDATAVVLTPSVVLIARRAKVDPVPLVLACAFVANAASFILPIANPANLVLYRSHPPPLFTWLVLYGVSSLVSTIVTGLALFVSQRKRLHGTIAVSAQSTAITVAMRRGFVGLACIALLLFVVSQAGLPLGAYTLLSALAFVGILTHGDRREISACIYGVSWGVLLLVPSLFMVAAAADVVGVTANIVSMLGNVPTGLHASSSAIFAGSITLASALANNLPVGLLLGHIFMQHLSSICGLHAEYARRVALVTVDLGPNIATSASLATILWLQILKRESIAFSPWQFLRIGTVITPLTLAATLATLRF